MRQPTNQILLPDLDHDGQPRQITISCDDLVELVGQTCRKVLWPALQRCTASHADGEQLTMRVLVQLQLQLAELRRDTQ